MTTGHLRKEGQGVEEALEGAMTSCWMAMNSRDYIENEVIRQEDYKNEGSRRMLAVCA
jgi:hypothetical protein